VKWKNKNKHCPIFYVVTPKKSSTVTSMIELYFVILDLFHD